MVINICSAVKDVADCCAVAEGVFNFDLVVPAAVKLVIKFAVACEQCLGDVKAIKKEVFIQMKE